MDEFDKLLQWYVAEAMKIELRRCAGIEADLKRLKAEKKRKKKKSRGS